MSKIGLFYGTQTGKTEQIASMIQEELGEDMVDIHDMSDVRVSDFVDYQHLIIGVPTWNNGELSSDWEAFFPELDDIDFNGKTVAYFGVGDQTGYADTFMDAIGILEAKISSQGGKTVCPWSTDGYDFEASKGVREGKFIGLALDEDNQGDLTESRIKTWIGQVKQAFSI
jgi:flavodoxin I